MLVERPNWCACIKIRPIEFREMAELFALVDFRRHILVVL